jgi:hypothetical protein
MKLLRSAIVVTAAVAVPLLPTAAHADRYTYADPAADVVSFPVSDGDSPTTTPAPDRAQGDVVASIVVHRRRNVLMRMQYRELDAGGVAAAHLFAIRTPTMTRLVTVFAGPGIWAGKPVMENSHGKKVRCHITRKLDYAANTATVIVPRSCLGNPRWVRGGMAGLTFDAADIAFADDARANGFVGTGTYGPRVHR